MIFFTLTQFLSNNYTATIVVKMLSNNIFFIAKTIDELGPFSEMLIIIFTLVPFVHAAVLTTYCTRHGIILKVGNKTIIV